MGSHHGHMALHQREEHDNKYNFIHIAGLGWVNRAEGGGDDNAITNDNVVTIISQVYVTEPKTFPGPAIYVTKTPVTETLPSTATTTAAQNSYESAKSVINQPKTRSHSAYPTSYGAEGVKGTPLAGGQISNHSNGMTAGAKAGVAIGVLAAIGMIAGLLLFCIRRRKNQLAERGDKLDEKHASKTSFFSGTAAAMGAPAGEPKRASFRSMTLSHTAATAPRLSLRPVTSLLPSIMEKRKSSANATLDIPAMSEKPKSNPFGDDKQVRSESPANHHQD